jgi:hypothetical protein
MGPSGSESSLVSQPFLVVTTVMPIQSSTNSTPIFGGDAFLDLGVSHHVQPAVVSMQYSAATTPIFGDDASLELVV